MAKFNPYNLHGQAFKDYIESEKKKIELIPPLSKNPRKGSSAPQQYVSINTYHEYLQKGDILVSDDSTMEIEIAGGAVKQGGGYRYQALAPLHYITDKVESECMWRTKKSAPEPTIIKAGELVDLTGFPEVSEYELSVGDEWGFNGVTYVRVTEIGYKYDKIVIRGEVLKEFTEGTHKWELITPPVYDIKWVQAGDFELLEKYEIV